MLTSAPGQCLYDTTERHLPGTRRGEEWPPDLFGCLHLHGVPLATVTVTLRQEGQDTQTTVTDADGCYQFHAVLSDTTVTVRIGPLTP